jgi:Family of unknown function (DUF6510)
MNDPTSFVDGFLDGNAAGGELNQIFAVDMTAAGMQCAGCGRTAIFADVRLYGQAGPGLVARCRACDGVLFRLVRAPGRAWLDLRGLNYLELPMPEDT